MYGASPTGHGPARGRGGWGTPGKGPRTSTSASAAAPRVSVEEMRRYLEAHTAQDEQGVGEREEEILEGEEPGELEQMQNFLKRLQDLRDRKARKAQRLETECRRGLQEAAGNAQPHNTYLLVDRDVRDCDKFFGQACRLPPGWAAFNFYNRNTTNAPTDRVLGSLHNIPTQLGGKRKQGTASYSYVDICYYAGRIASACWHPEDTKVYFIQGSISRYGEVQAQLAKMGFQTEAVDGMERSYESLLRENGVEDVSPYIWRAAPAPVFQRGRSGQSGYQRRSRSSAGY